MQDGAAEGGGSRAGGGAGSAPEHTEAVQPEVRPPGWWLASDGNWYPPQEPVLPSPEPAAEAPAPAARRWSTMQLMASAGAAAAVALLLGFVVGGSGDDGEENGAAATSEPSEPTLFPDENGDGVSDDAPTGVDEEDEPPPTSAVEEVDQAEGTSREDPVPFGEAAQVGSGWSVKVLETNTDATAVIAAENEFNERPPAGEQLVMATIEATYNGPEQQASTYTDLYLNAVGQSNVEIAEYSCESVLPNDLSEAGDVYQGGTVTGNVCWSVPTGDVSSLLMAVEELASFEGQLTFFALG